MDSKKVVCVVIRYLDRNQTENDQLFLIPYIPKGKGKEGPL